MKHGDLLHFLRERDSKEEKESGAKQEGLKRKNSDFFNPLSLSELWVIFKQTVAAIRYLHFQNVVHGDIKPHVNFHFCHYFNNVLAEYSSG